jgi:hypothetical protein
MATVPGPNPDQPLPRPGAPAHEPMREPDRERDDDRHASPNTRPEWEDAPPAWSPEREQVERDMPAGVP